MSPDQMDSLINSDREFKRHLMTSLEEVKGDMKEMKTFQYEQALLINTLKVKMGIGSLAFGAIGGTISIIASILVK